MKRLCILLTLVCFSCFAATWTMADDNLFTLEKAIKLALKRGLSIRLAEEEIRAREFEERSHKADFYPKLSTEYSYTRLDRDTVNDAKYTMYLYDPSKPGFYPKRYSPLQTDNYNFTLTATQPLFTGWRLTLSREMASLGVDTAEIQKKTVVQSLILSAKEAYYGILKAEKFKNVAEQALEMLKSHLNVSRAFYKEGLISRNDLLETKVQMAQAQQDLIGAKNRLELAKSLFNKLLRRELNKPVSIKKPIFNYKPVPENLSPINCLKEAKSNRPEIKEMMLNIALAQKAIEYSEGSYYPNVTMIGNYKREADNPVLEGDTGEDADNWTLTLNLEWTFWEWGKKAHEVAASKARLRKAEYLLEKVKDNIALEVKDAYLYLKEAEENIQVAKTAVLQAEENFRINIERYKQHIGTSTDVLDAQTLLTRAKTNYFNALSEFSIAWARLERAMGTGYKKQ